MTTCEDCVVCSECGEHVVVCLSEPRPSDWPCPHFERVCAECWPNGCRKCEEAAKHQHRFIAEPVGQHYYGCGASRPNPDEVAS